MLRLSVENIEEKNNTEKKNLPPSPYPKTFEVF